MPQERFKRYTEIYGLNSEEARLIIKDKDFSDFYDEAVAVSKEYKKTANIMNGELNRYMNDSGKTLSEIKLTPGMLSELIGLIGDGKITNNGAKALLVYVCGNGKTPIEAAGEQGLIIKEDPQKLLEACRKVIEENQKNVEAYKNGKTQLFGFFMGQAIHILGKGTSPESVKNTLEKLLK